MSMKEVAKGEKNVCVCGKVGAFGEVEKVKYIVTEDLTLGIGYTMRRTDDVS